MYSFVMRCSAVLLAALVALQGVKGSQAPSNSAATPAWHALHEAAAAGRGEAVTTHLASVQVDAGEGGCTALHRAAEGGHTNVALKLVAAGGSVHAASQAHLWRTPAEVAYVWGNWDAATHLALLQFGAPRKMVPYIVTALPAPLDRHSLSLLDSPTLVQAGLSKLQARRVLQRLTAFLSPGRALLQRAWFGFVLPHDPESRGW